MLGDFFPARNFGVLTYSALKAYVDKIAPSWLTMKGFVAGDAGAEQFGNVTFTRKEFKPLILWHPACERMQKEWPVSTARLRTISHVFGLSQSGRRGTINSARAMRLSR